MGFSCRVDAQTLENHQFAVQQQYVVCFSTLSTYLCEDHRDSIIQVLILACSFVEISPES